MPVLRMETPRDSDIRSLAQGLKATKSWSHGSNPDILSPESEF